VSRLNNQLPDCRQQVRDGPMRGPCGSSQSNVYKVSLKHIHHDQSGTCGTPQNVSVPLVFVWKWTGRLKDKNDLTKKMCLFILSFEYIIL
jgi:hypothetical protein